MADANVAAIQGNPLAPLNPLQTLSGWQDYANKVQENRNMVLQNQTGQQTLATTMQVRHNQIMAGLLGLPNEQLGPAASAALDRELQSGQVDQQRYDVMKQHLQENANNPDALRQTIASGLVSNLQPEQALQAQVPSIVNQDIGGQIVPRVMPSPASLLTNPQQGVGVAPGAITKTQSPTYINTGGQNVPVGGGAGSPILNQSLTPGEGTALQDRLVKNDDGSYSVVTQQLQQWNPALAPGGSRGAAPAGATAGATPATGVGPGGKMVLGGGGYPQPPVTSVPLGTKEQLTNDQTAYQTDQQAAPALTTGVQSLNKALVALNAVATGAGTEGLAKMRAFATSIGNVVGVPTGGINVQDMNRAQIEKYLTDYARVSGSAGRSDEALTAAFKSNASGSINNAAAQDVVRTNMGRDLQKVAASMSQPNAQGSGYSAYKARFFQQTDPRGFAWNTYTPQQQQQMLKEAQGTQGTNSPAYKKLVTAIGLADQLNLSTHAPGPNVNASPPTQ